MGDQIYRFAEFELLASSGELRTKDSCIRLQEKPLQLLLALVENPQRVVTRHQLRQRMWGSDTFVDYELGINVAVKKVRDSLGDSAENPRFIQTLAKKGYRFLVPVEVMGAKVTAPAVSVPQVVGTDQPSPAAALTRVHPVRHRWVLTVLAIGVLMTVGLWFYEARSKSAHPVQIRSLAVLPLRNLSPDPGQEYFADGITEEVITNLAQSLPLRVISRTSVMRYKQSNEPITQIARELGVEAIVEGAVARSGSRVTVTIQLIDATEDRHLWAQKYDRNLGDLLSMEAELSQQVAGQVGATLSAQRAIHGTKSRPVDPQVYEFCLLGRYHWNKRTAADLAKSEEYYRQALTRDATYAPAHAGLADAYALMPSYDSVGVKKSFAKAVAAARQALELDNNLAEAHATLALVALSENVNGKEVEPEFRRALELNPNYAPAHHWLAFYLFLSDRHDEALAEMELARQLDPLSPMINADEGHFLFAARRYEEASVRLRQAIELAPNLGQPHGTLALIALETGHTSEALQEARAGLALDPSNSRTIAEGGYVLAATGQTAEARRLLATLKDMIHRGAGFLVNLALIQLGLGERDEALDTLKEIVDSGGGLEGLALYHAFDELKSDPRYQKLVSQARQ